MGWCMRVGCVVVALGFVGLVGGCKGVSTVWVVANGSADVFVDGQAVGAAPTKFPLPWSNVGNTINYAQRRVRVLHEGKVVFEKDISGDIVEKAQTGDYEDGSTFGTGRTYTVRVDVNGGAGK